MKNLTNLYRFEIRQNRKSFFIWFISLALIMFLFMCMYPSFKSADYLELVNAKINALPRGVGTAFGLGGVTGINFQDLYFFFSYMTQFYVIAIVIYAINLGSTIVSKENEEKHIDYLATKPIRKKTILVSKYSTLLTYIFCMTGGLFIIGLGTIAVFSHSGNLYVAEMLRLHTKLLVEYIFFGTLAFSISAYSKRTSKSSLIVVSIFFVTYLLGIASQIVHSLAWLKNLSPYFIFSTTEAGYKFSAIDWRYILILILLSAFLLFSAIYRYQRKDLSL